MFLLDKTQEKHLEDLPPTVPNLTLHPRSAMELLINF